MSKQYAIRDRRLTSHLSRLTKPMGFSLIELIVVISIIGILAALTLVSYSTAQRQARDTQRKNDLSQYRNGLENYGTANDSLYPVYSSRQNVAPGTALCNVLSPDFISSCPADPGEYTYQYRSDGTADTGDPEATQYVLWVELESGDYWWEVCSDGRSGKLDTSPSAGDGDQDGACQVP